MSEPHTLASAILMSMAPGSGSGTGYSRISNGVPVPWKTARRAVSGMGRSSLVAVAEQREGAGRVGEDDGRGRTEIAAIQLRELRDTEEAHGDAHLVLEQLERADQAGRPRGGEAATGQAAEADDLGAERDRLHHAGAAAVAAVHEDGGASAHRGDHLGQDLGAPRAVIELAPAMIRHVHAVHAVLHRDGRVLGGGDALEDERDRVPVLEALDLLPRERGLEIHAGHVLAPRLHEAPGEVALAAAVHSSVPRHAEGGVAVVDRALDVVVHELVVAAHVELEDAEVVRGGGGGLESWIARGGEHLRHAELARADGG